MLYTEFHMHQNFRTGFYQICSVMETDIKLETEQIPYIIHVNFIPHAGYSEIGLVRLRLAANSLLLVYKQKLC